MELESKTILLVEDEAIVALLEKRWLTNEGFKVIHCTTGEQAVNIIRSGQETIDLILMDIDLGAGIDGTQAAIEILQFADIPLLFLSSHMEPAIVKLTEHIGSYGYVVKGSSVTVLIASIKMAFRLFYANRKLKEKEKSLLERDERFRTLADSNPLMIWVTDAKGGNRFVNKTYLDYFKTTSEMVEGNKWQPYFHPDDVMHYIDTFLKSVEEQKTFKAEARVRRPDGEWRWISSYAEPSFAPDGKFLGHIGNSQDVTERKQNEEALLYSNDFLNNIIETSPHAIWISDENGLIIKSNQSLRDFFNISAEDLTGKYNIFLDNIIDEQGYMPLVKHLFETGNSVRFTLFYDSSTLKQLKIFKKTYLYLDVSISAMLNSNGKVTNAIIQYVDVTAVKNAELKLQEYAAELKKINNTKDKLFSMIAHDLRGPFSGFIGLTETIANNSKSMSLEEITEYGKAMYLTAKKNFDLLDSLLEWARLQKGEIKFNPMELDLFSITENICLLFSSAAKNKCLSIINEIKQNRIIYADDLLISTVLRNLISNAIKFTNSGGRILIQTEERDRHIEISVTDDGIGMSAEKLGKIFDIDSKNSTRGTNDEEGSGLGLVICKDMLEQNAGKMEVKSHPGKGSTFTFKLPLKTEFPINV